jgi:antagonist of KipI
MSSLEIIHPGLMTSIQDLGRRGLAFYAIPNSGVMDQNAAKIALLLLHKNEDSPLIECTSIAPQILFHGSTRIVLTGADFNWQINGQSVPLNQIIQIQKGDLLKGQSAKDKLRGYIAFSGDLILEKTYRSYATYTHAQMGGYRGRLLKKGDIIAWKNAVPNDRIIRIKKGPEYDLLSDQAKSELINTSFIIDADSNRMGVRLQGKKLESSDYQLENSAPVLPGFIQLPPSGLPIVVLQDGQTTGGYPRIAYIPTAELSKFNQIPIGGGLKFSLIS